MHGPILKVLRLKWSCMVKHLEDLAFHLPGQAQTSWPTADAKSKYILRKQDGDYGDYEQTSREFILPSNLHTLVSILNNDMSQP